MDEDRRQLPQDAPVRPTFEHSTADPLPASLNSPRTARVPASASPCGPFPTQALAVPPELRASPPEVDGHTQPRLPLDNHPLSPPRPLNRRDTGGPGRRPIEAAGAQSPRVTVLKLLPTLNGTRIYERYWYFAAERQAIFFNRLQGLPAPWTYDPILNSYKFTNAYRASDRVSQYLIRHVIYRDDLPSDADEIFFRIALFKLFNSVRTWQLLERTLGTITWSEYSFNAYDRILSQAMADGGPIYSSAYIMPSGHRTWGFPRKHQNHLAMLQQMMSDEVPERLRSTYRMEDGFAILRRYPSIGDFLAYQLITDINYSSLVDYSEMEFVVPGPGANSGIRKCFSNLEGISPAYLVRMVAHEQESEFARRGLSFRSLWGRPLQLIDCQNLFCEIDKYTRVSDPEIQGTLDRRRIKHRFTAHAEPLTPWYPPLWGLNDKIALGETASSELNSPEVG